MRLGINIDHVATLRQARGGDSPDPVEAAFRAVAGGADQITVHLREDRRHMQDRDLDLLKRTLTVPMNLEMAATPEMIGVARALAPDWVCLVPERREERTTEGGLDVAARPDPVADVIAALAGTPTRVSLFIEADAAQIEAAARLGAHAIEIHTGQYALARRAVERGVRLGQIAEASRLAASLGLRVHAGHGLDYHNTHAVVAVPEIEELNIGHAIIARAVFCGLESAVRAMRDLIGEARAHPRRAH